MLGKASYGYVRNGRDRKQYGTKRSIKRSRRYCFCGWGTCMAALFNVANYDKLYFDEISNIRQLQ